jgi:hypothetical protein
MIVDKHTSAVGLLRQPYCLVGGWASCVSRELRRLGAHSCASSVVDGQRAGIEDV